MIAKIALGVILLVLLCSLGVSSCREAENERTVEDYFNVTPSQAVDASIGVYCVADFLHACEFGATVTVAYFTAHSTKTAWLVTWTETGSNAQDSISVCFDVYTGDLIPCIGGQDSRLLRDIPQRDRSRP